MSQSTQPPQPQGGTIQVNSRHYPLDVYHVTGRAVGTQQWVANQWARGALPVNSKSETTALRSSTGNFRGIQHPDGSGLLKHYAHIEAIRTRNGVILNDTECWSRGWAHCSVPLNPRYDHSLPLTTLERNTPEGENLYDIVAVHESPKGSDQPPMVEFESGAERYIGDII